MQRGTRLRNRGSIKLPAAAHGVTALKPSWGRVSRHSVFELATNLDHIGPITRSVTDAATMLGVIAGPDKHDPTAAQSPVPNYAARLADAIDGMRTGIDPGWICDGVDAETADALNAAVTVLNSCGAVIKSVKVPDVSAMIWDWFPICTVQAARSHHETFPSRRNEYGPALTHLLDMGLALSGLDYQKLIMTNIDDDLIAGLHRFMCPFNLSGSPGLVLPGGINREGLPIVFQLLGRHFEEELLLAAGAAYPRETNWHQQVPVPAGVGG